MATTTVNPTRMELKRQKNKLVTARRGHKLLKDKCDELVKRFLEIVRENKELRTETENALAKVYSSFSVAAAAMTPEMLTEALMLPKTKGNLGVSYENIMSVNVPKFDFKIEGGGEDKCNYGLAFTSGELDSAISELSDLLPKLLLLAEKEKAAQLLSDEIEKTRRRVNALEYVMIPETEAQIKRITMKLEENERGTITRLMKVKDMMIQEQIRAKQNNM